MTNPYAPPVHVEPSGFRFTGWKRAILWAFGIFAAYMLMALLWGLSMGLWMMVGDTVQDGITMGRYARKTVLFLLGTLLYWRFATKTPTSRLGNVLAVYGLVQVIDIATSLLVFRAPLDQVLTVDGTVGTLGAAMAGLILATLRKKHASLRSKLPSKDCRQ